MRNAHRASSVPMLDERSFDRVERKLALVNAPHTSESLVECDDVPFGGDDVGGKSDRIHRRSDESARRLGGSRLLDRRREVEHDAFGFRETQGVRDREERRFRGAARFAVLERRLPRDAVPASDATSSRRGPRTRRRGVEGRSTSGGSRRARRSLRNRRNSAPVFAHAFRPTAFRTRGPKASGTPPSAPRGKTVRRYRS